MPRHPEPLDGGLWTAADPAALSPGQLTYLQNAVYRRGSKALWRATGRSAAGTASATAVDVNGLRDAQFDNGDHYLFALASTNLTSGIVGDTITFGTLTAFPATAAQLEAVHYRNRFYLLNGIVGDAASINTNFVTYLTATAVSNTLTGRQHGMVPVNAAPSTSATATAFSQTVTGYYEYWTTEVAKLTQDGAGLTLESAFAADSGPSTVYVTSTGMTHVIQMPPVRNSITTHWRIYRSPKKDKESDKKFPTGFMIAEQATASAAMTDTNATVTASAFPANVNSAGFFFGFASASAAFADDGTYASASVGAFPIPVQQAYYGFNFGGFSGSVRGFTFEVQGYATAAGMLPVPISVTLGLRATDGNFAVYVDRSNQFPQVLPRIASKSGNITSSNSASPTMLTLGSSTDRWFSSNTPGLSDTDFTATRLMAVVAVSKPNAVVGIDYIKGTVYYSGSVDSTVVYPSVVYTFGDITSQVSKNHPPPSASTGDLFEDTLVLNDVNAPALIRWSFPGDPEVFPPTYFIDFETRENDQVRLIKVVNSQLVVALDSSIWRVNYLPSERDSSFDRGKAIAPISRSYGCVNPMCACTFSMDGSPEMLAFVSDTGIHITDGFSFNTVTDGLDWRQIISTTDTSTNIDLINDREKQELIFHYRNDAFGNNSYRALHLSYAKDHVVNGRLKISGPVNMRNLVGFQLANLKSAWPVQRSNGATDIFLGYGNATAAGGGQVWREASAATLPAQDSTMKYVTRRMYLNEMGNEWVGNEVYGYCGSYDGSPVITYTAQNTKTNDAGPATIYSKSITLGGQKLHKVSPRATFEGMQITATVASASAFSQEHLIIEGEGWGEEDSGG